MAKQSGTGVYQLSNGCWAYRYTLTQNGHMKDVRKARDQFGNPIRSKKEAIQARQQAIEEDRENRHPAPRERKTVGEVFREYCQSGRRDRAYQTIRKQDSLWKNHLNVRFGRRMVDEISSAEITDYLAELYYESEFSYQYTESFLKMFYLIFGQAYSRNYLEVDIYNRLCINKDTKIKMPKKKAEDDTGIVSFSREDLEILDKYFKGTNAETAYLLGRYCGLRINEACGLKWDHVDLEKGTIRIDRQQQYQNGVIKLIAPKTHNSNRTIYLCPAIWTHLKMKRQQREKDVRLYADLREQRQRFIEDLDGKKISSTELVNCLPDGTIQTVNSMKYPTREIKKKFGINFKFHYLRHTFGTMMAELNTPTHLLCNQMGHGNIHTTQRYYIAVSKSGIDILKHNLEHL